MSVLFAVAASYSAASGQEVVEHRLKWFETLNLVARKYGVTVDDILKYNHLESGSDVKPGTILIIPMGGIGTVSDVSQPVPADEEWDISENRDTVFSEEVPTSRDKKIYNASNPLKVSLVLPFGAGQNEPSVNYFDFYSGVLMAMDSLKAKGVNVILNVFDNKSDSPEKIFLDPFFATSDLIIGPVQKEDLEVFAQYGLEHRIPVVSPMDHAVEHMLEGNPYLFQVPASVTVQERNMIDFLDITGNDKVLVIYDSSNQEEPYVNRLTDCLDSLEIDYRKIGYGLLSGRTKSNSLKKELSRDCSYKVIVASEDDAFAPDIVRNMRVLKLFSIPIELYCSNRVRNFESIDSDSFFELSTHVCAPYYIDYSSDAVKKFVFRYRALYNTEPTPYAFQGYDVFSFFVSNMYASGDDFENYLPDCKGVLLQSNMRFTRRDENCGWQNTATRNIIYNEDFTISTVK